MTRGRWAAAGVFLAIPGFAVLFLAVSCGTWRVPSSSMAPTILNGEVVLARRGGGTPVRGQVVVFRDVKTGKDFVKRIVALAGDVVEMKKGVLILNGTPVAHHGSKDVSLSDYDASVRGAGITSEETIGGARWTILEDPRSGDYRDTPPTTVPDGHVWVLGDFRTNSVDSRVLGPIAVGDLRARPWRVLTGRTGHPID